METLTTDNPGDCQAVAADSTTTITTAVVASSERRSAPRTRSITHSEDVSSTTTAASAAATSSSSMATTKQGASTPPTTTTAATHANNSNIINNNNNNSKIKSQQQQQQQQQQKFQFRAPQQFVKHRKAISMLAKKNKTWNKRQNKCHLQKQQQQQQQQVTCSALTAGGVVSGLALAAAVGGGTLPATKADLENIQNLKNQLGSGGGHHHQYHHHHGGHHGGGRGGGGGGGSNANGIAPCLCALDKLGYGHGHLKQQLYKKMLAHRGHHHHVLCAGAAHNASGGGGGTNSACCLVNGCTIQNGKDATNSNSHNNSSHANITHYCCGRSKFFLPDKRPRKEIIIPPTKFLLGGTISDPLNLNSLQNESASNVSSNNNTPATTPRQSPITTPPKVEVIIPPNIYDPLHLLDPVDSMEYEKQLTSPMKRKTKASTKKHRHRKNRKPKRRRYESYNSTTMEEDASSLAGSNATIANTSLANSTLLTDISTTSSTIPMSISLSLNSVENTSGDGGETSGIVNEEHEEKRISPAPHGSELIELSSTPTEQVEKNNITLSPSKNQQHVAGGVIGESVGATVEILNVRRTSERERVSKDLRLDLSMCGVSGGTGIGGGGAGNNHNNNNNSNTSASSSTCGSIGTTAGSAGLGGGGRKRKISESSNSQKNKKFHRVDSMDKIVSPVVPQPGAWKRPPRLVPTGARKSSRRSTSVSETELLSPVDETNKTINDSESNRGDTPDLSKMEPMSEAAAGGSPLSTASGATSVTAGEQDSMPDINVGEAAPIAQVAAITTAGPSVATTTIPSTTAIAQLTKMPKFRADGAKYQYGNYDRYAGFLHLNEFMDVRLQVFQRHLELFKNKDILDIGCNVGHMTITVARSLAPKSILGIDIDKELIARARRNLSMYVRIPSEARVKSEIKPKAKPEDSVASQKSKRTRRQKKKKTHQQATTTAITTTSHLHHHHHHHLLLHHQHHQQHLTSKIHVDAAEFFPVSFPINYGGMPDLTCAAATPSTSGGTPGNISGSGGCTAPSNSAGVCASGGSGSGVGKLKNDFPKNVFFRHNNYVLKDEALLNNDSQQYDLIMCLSVTKWIHLNFGDNGLKMAFKRMFNQLRPGGKLILEAQNWASYKKKKNLTEQIYNNYSKIEFFPNKFHEYLLSSEVGFSHSYTLGVPRHLNKGFCRPIQLYAKGDYTPNHVRWSDAYYPQTPYEAYRGIYATMAPRTHPLISSSRSQNYDTPHHPGIGGGGGGGGGGGPGSGSYSCRQTPMHQPTSQYYNPLETDSYLPSYDMEYLNHLYVFASPLYQTVWSPPASLRNSSTHTPLFGSVRDAELDGDVISGSSAGGGSYHRHVYPPNDDTSSPNANAGGAFSSIRDPDTDDSNQLPASSVQHVYATNCESSSSPQVLHPHESETIDVSLMLADEAVVNGANNCCGDSNEA